MATRPAGLSRREIVALVILGTVLAAFTLPALRTLWDAFGTQHPDLAGITRWTEIAFPRGSELVGSDSIGGPDRSITAVVKMKRSKVSRFISAMRKSTECEEYKWTGGTRSKSDPPAWWDLGEARNVRSFLSRPRHPKGDTRCTVDVRQDDPNYAFVYMDGILH